MTDFRIENDQLIRFCKCWQAATDLETLDPIFVLAGYLSGEGVGRE